MAKVAAWTLYLSGNYLLSKFEHKVDRAKDKKITKNTNVLANMQKMVCFFGKIFLIFALLALRDYPNYVNDKLEHQCQWLENGQIEVRPLPIEN